MSNSWKKAHIETLRKIDQKDHMKDNILAMYNILIYKGY